MRSGFWWNPQFAGWGLDLHMAKGRMVATWATYDENGEPTWYLGLGERDGSGAWVIPLNQYRWDGSEIDDGTQVGQLTLNFADDGHHAQMAWRLGARTGSTPIEAFVVDQQPVAEDLTGFWYRTDASGYGKSLVTQGDKFFGVVYLYDRQGEPTWVWVDNLDSGNQGGLTALRMSNGPCPSCPATEVSSEPAGTASMTFLSENEALWSLDVTAGAADRQQSWSLSNRVVRQLTDRASGREERYQLQPFTNDDLLRQYLLAGINGGSNYPVVPPEFDFSPSPPTAEVSQTNLQEAGVDEADLIKSDGEYVYSVTPQTYGTNPQDTTVRILRMVDGAGLDEVANLPLSIEGLEVTGLYLVEHAGQQADQLLVMMNEPVYYYFDVWFAPFEWMNATTQVVAIDISDRAKPSVAATLQLDGRIVADRRIDDQLYLVTRFIPNVGEDAEALGEMLPRWRLNGVDQGALVDADRVLLPPQPPSMYLPDLVTVSAFDIDALAEGPKTETYAGLAETVYVSTDNLFISSSRYGYGVDPARTDLPAFAQEAETDVHQFALSETGPTYMGSGAAGGILTWGAISPSFKFSEYDGQLRVLTTRGDWLDQHQQLTVLDLANEQTNKLELRSFIPNSQRPELIGKPGETLRGVRFLADRLYAVTFRQIDPFYVVDISDRDDPFVAGELEIPGFSEYLHPLSQDLVLGFGENVDPVTGRQKGLQMSLFDVSDPNIPTQLERIVMGGPGSFSPLLTSHLAFSMLPGNSERAVRVAVPVELQEPTGSGFWDMSGLARFEITGVDDGQSPSLIWRDTLISASAEAGEDPSDIYPGRGLISAENSYLYLGDGSFYTAPWGSDQVGGPY